MTNIYEVSNSSGINIEISNFLVYESDTELIDEIYKGLSKDKKQISSRFFYDDIGSEFFERITHLPEYYPTRAEKSILKKYAGKIVADLRNNCIIELGSGDCSKISILLGSISPHELSAITYIPVDVSRQAIIKSAHELKQHFPLLAVHGVLADFMKHIDKIEAQSPKTICFFGSTLGNLTKNQSFELLGRIRELMNGGDRFILGIDMVKDEQVLFDAYNDKQGVTEAFNKNILNVVNSIAGTNFKPDKFEHKAFFNRSESRIEMHLEALCDMKVISPNFKKPIHIAKGETIHTENSHKFTSGDIKDFAHSLSFEIEEVLTDSSKWFSVVVFRKK